MLVYKVNSFVMLVIKTIIIEKKALIFMTAQALYLGFIFQTPSLWTGSNVCL